MSQATARRIGRFLIFLGIVNLIIVFTYQVFGKEVQIIDIRKNLKLSNNEKQYTDYYLNAGADLGIKPGTMFMLYRRVSVIDRLGTNQGRPLSLPVGKIKIIYVSKDLSVARIEKLDTNETSPLIEYRGVMLGDLINVESAEMSKDTKAAHFGPQGLDVSFQAKPVVIPEKAMTTTTEEKVAEKVQKNIQRKPATTTAKKQVVELKAEIKPDNTEVQKASLKEDKKPQEIQLIR